MNTLIIVVIGYLVLCIIAFALRKIMPLVALIGWTAAFYLFFAMQERVYGIILFVLVVVLSAIVKICNDEQAQEEGKCKKELAKNRRIPIKRSSNLSMNKVLMYMIPIFWPYLIIKAILSMKQVKIDMTPYDYEQHLKSNGK